MSHLVHHIPRVPSTEGIDEGLVESNESRGCKYVPFTDGGQIYILNTRAIAQMIQHSTSVDPLDDDSLLNVFRLYRPPLLDGDEDHIVRALLGKKWNRERWWYKLAHVCRRWRYLILGSASHLDLCLLFTPGTPVADMLASSPPFPIIIDHFHTVDDGPMAMTADDEEGIILALKHRDRVRRVRLRTSFPITEKVTAPIDGEFPTLEYLCVAPIYKMEFLFPKTFQAPQLRHLILVNLACPIGSPLLTSAIGLVALSLVNIPPSAYFRPDELLNRISLMPQLEILWISFEPKSFGHYAGLDVTHKHISLPNLHFFQFDGYNIYLEAVLSRITAPHLEAIRIIFWEQWSFSVERLLQFMSTSEDLNFKLGSAMLSFDNWEAKLEVYPNTTTQVPTFNMYVEGSPGHKVSNAARILYTLTPLFSSVLCLALDYKDNRFLPELQREANPADWRGLLRSFNNVQTLFAAHGAVDKLSRSLQSDDESPNDLLPKLKEIIYSPTDDNADAFKGFIDARQNAGRPVALVHLDDALSTLV
jgi:hypothetical protein